MGGGEYALYNLLSGIDREKIKPIMIFNKRGEFVEKIESLGVETNILPFQNVMLKTLIYPKRFWKLIKDTITMYRFFKKNRPDVIQVGDVLSLMMIAAPALRFRIPVLYTLIFFYEWSRMIVFNLLAIIFVKKIVANSVALRNDLTRRTLFLSKQIDVIYHAVDTSRFRPRESGEENLLLKELSLSSGTKLIGMVGRFDPCKGHIVFLRAMAELMKRRSDVKGIVRGGQLFVDVFLPFQKYHEKVMRYHRELKLEDKVIFLSHRNDMPEIYRALDVLVCPSLLENIPLTIYEAMASGIPVVAADVGGIPEQIEHGKNGFLFKAGDPDALCMAILECLSADRSKLTGAALHKLNHAFTMERYITSMEKVYKTFAR